MENKRWIENNGIETDNPPPGWEFVENTQDDSFNKNGILNYSSVFETRLGGNGTPTYDLTILKEGDQFRAAHGSVVMPGLISSAKEAAAVAMGWYVENGLQPGQSVPAKYSDNIGLSASSLEGFVPASNCVREGNFSGRILDVTDGMALQKVNRVDTVLHDASRLSAHVKAGDVVDIGYRDGRGAVSVKGQSVGVGR